jgi:hypothetical protein
VILELRRRARIVAYLIVVGLLYAPSAWGRSPRLAYQERHGCQNNTVPIYSLDVKAKPVSKVYRVGETALIDVTVLRPADHNPVDPTLPWLPPPRKDPAPDVIVGVSLSVGKFSFFTGGGITGENGKTRVKIKLRSYSETGAAHLSVFAFKTAFEDPARCFILQEQGFFQKRNALTVEK